MEFPFSVVIQWLSDFLLPLVRISSMIMIMAGIGGKKNPFPIKNGFGVVVPIFFVAFFPLF